jgi:hypothetical protein
MVLKVPDADEGFKSLENSMTGIPATFGDESFVGVNMNPRAVVCWSSVIFSYRIDEPNWKLFPVVTTAFCPARLEFITLIVGPARLVIE